MSKNILFFFPENPFSNRAGNVVRAKTTLSILKKLGHHIDLVGVKDIYNEQNDSTAVDTAIVDNLFLINQKPPKNKTSLDYWKHKFSKTFQKPNEYNFALTDFIKKEFLNVFLSKKYDVIIINYEFWTGLIDHESMNNTLKIVDTHDWITLNEFYKNKKLDIGNRFNEEIKNLSKFDKVITISQDEHIVFEKFIEKPVINIPPSFPSHFNDHTDKKYDLIFVGSENYFNIKSMQWFFDDVHPLLPSHINIVVIGRISKHFEKRNGVEFIEFSESLEEYYHQSKIAICPMLEGTGIKIKVIEALSYGLPVMGTDRAVDGFSSKTSNGCLISNNEKGFADAIIKILSNEDGYKKLTSEAIEYFNHNFSEEKATELWREVIN